MDAIVKSYAAKLVKQALADNKIKLSHIGKSQFNEAVKAVIAANPNIKEQAYKEFNN